MYIPIGINTILGSNRYKLSKTLLTILMKSISPTEWMLSTQTKRSEGTGALKYSSAMAGSKPATDKQH